MKRILGRASAMGVAATVAAVGVATPASAAEPAFVLEFNAGRVCVFKLSIEVYGEGSQQYKEFTDKDGNVVRTLSAGTGYALVYTNVDKRITFSTKSNGAASRTQRHPDGSSTNFATGHNVILLEPTDKGGPSATLYTGQVVYTVDSSGVFEVVKESGKKLDICAKLSP